MKRYNLLVVTGEQKTNDLVCRELSRHRKVKFALQASQAVEAHLLLSRLNIQVLVIDLDSSEHDILQFNRAYPKLTIWGMSHQPERVLNRVDPLRNIVLSKNGLVSALLTEIKILSKEASRKQSFGGLRSPSKQPSANNLPKKPGLLAKQ